MISGSEAEQLFYNAMSKQCKEVIKSTKDEDMFLHFDYTCDGIKYDVKTQKRFNRHDRDVSEVFWIEYTNVRGNPGWVRGEADKIAFLCGDRFLVVDRRKLLSFISTFVEDSTVYHVKDYKKWYGRRYRKDVLTFLYPSDMVNLVEREIMLL